MTIDFIAGMMYNRIANGMMVVLSRKHTTYEFPFKIRNFNPIFWEKVIYKSTLVENVVQIVVDEFTRNYGKEYTITIARDFPYVQEDFEVFITIKKKEPEYKEMTVADIEKELGYKIKIINK